VSIRAFLLASTALAAAVAPLPTLAQSAAPQLEVGLHGSADALGGEIGLFAPVELGAGAIAYGSFYAGILPATGEFYGSAGLGIRSRLGDGLVLGGNLHLDALRSAHGNAYQQISAGLELLSRDFEFRLEGNAPFGATANAEDGLSAVTVENDALAIRQGYEVALYGLRAEAGIRLPVFADDGGRSLKLFAEAFTRTGERVGPIHGLGARVELQLASFEQWPGSVTLGGGVSHDSTGQTSARAILRLSAPLGGKAGDAALPTDPLYARVGHTPRVATAAGAYGDAESANYADGRAVGTVQRLSAASGGATDINALVAGAGIDALLLVDGEIALDDAIQLAMGQTMLGGHGTLTVLSDVTGKQYQFTSSGERGRLVAAPVAGVAAVELADSTSVLSLDIAGGGHGLSAEGVSDITIRDVAIADTLGHGIRMVDVDGATISDVSYTSEDGCNGCSSMSYTDVYGTVTNAALYGVGLRNATIDGFTTDGAAWGLVFAGLHDGTDITAAAENITVRNATIRNTSEEAILFYVAENIDVSGFEIDNAGRSISEVHDGVVFMSSRDISLGDGSIKGGVNGLMFIDPVPLPLVNGNITVADVTIEDTFRAGIFFNSTSDVTLRNIDIVRPGAIEYTAGVYHYAAWPDAISNIVYDDVRIRDVVHADSAGITFIGDNDGISGTLSIETSPTVCNNWGAVTASTLLINGDPLTGAC